MVDLPNLVSSSELVSYLDIFISYIFSIISGPSSCAFWISLKDHLFSVVMVKASTEISVSILNFFSAFKQGSQPSQKSSRERTFFPSEVLLRCCVLPENKEIFSYPVRNSSFSRSTINLNFCRKSRPRIQELVISAM
ncbi:hypothetical protein AVEN_112567-1 [Araneus ventricosus]|uniref:Uncharacterized protein n=1 Tax=Araneus ventricosus TaxID=182803 RepID=A0A4Y2P854_ARAVE|nr:hypothetical protein AVEN_112567-1 [Araneus ventricosus]